MSRILLEPGISQRTSNPLVVGRGDSAPVTLHVGHPDPAQAGLTGAEVALIEVSLDGGGSFRPFIQAAAQVSLTATDPAVALHSPGVFRVVLPVTATPVGVYASSRENP